MRREGNRSRGLIEFVEVTVDDGVIPLCRLGAPRRGQGAPPRPKVVGRGCVTGKPVTCPLRGEGPVGTGDHTPTHHHPFPVDLNPDWDTGKPTVYKMRHRWFYALLLCITHGELEKRGSVNGPNPWVNYGWSKGLTNRLRSRS